MSEPAKVAPSTIDLRQILSFISSFMGFNPSLLYPMLPI